MPEIAMPSRTASCCCGQLQIEVQGEPEGVGVCHCFACQRRTGSVFAALAGFRAPFAVTGKATEYVRTGDQGAKFRFRSCPVASGLTTRTPRISLDEIPIWASKRKPSTRDA